MAHFIDSRKNIFVSGTVQEVLQRQLSARHKRADNDQALRLDMVPNAGAAPPRLLARHIEVIFLIFFCCRLVVLFVFPSGHVGIEFGMGVFCCQ